MISFNSLPRFGGHHDKPVLLQNGPAASSQPIHQQESELLNRMLRSTGALGSHLSMASFQSHASHHSHSTQGNSFRHSNRYSKSAPQDPPKKQVVGRINMEAYQQLLGNSLTYRWAVDQFAQDMSKQILDWRPRAADLLTQIRSAEIDPQGADLILNNLDRTTEALEDVQRNLDYVINNHRKMLKTVRQDPRFDRKA